MQELCKSTSELRACCLNSSAVSQGPTMSLGEEKEIKGLVAPLRRGEVQALVRLWLACGC